MNKNIENFNLHSRKRHNAVKGNIFAIKFTIDTMDEIGFELTNVRYRQIRKEKYIVYCIQIIETE